MSSLDKMLSILDLFSEERYYWTPEEIGEKLQVSLPTAYRYLRQLTSSRMLVNENGHYALGPRVMELDSLMRRGDVVVKYSKGPMHEILKLTGCDVILSKIYEDRVLVNYIATNSEEKSIVTYTRGRAHPLFEGASAKVLLANLSRYRKEKIYEMHSERISEIQMGDSLSEFLEYLSKIKRQNYYVSHEEIDHNVSGIAVPLVMDTEVLGALSIALPTQRFDFYNEEKMLEILWQTAEQIKGKIVTYTA